MRRFLAEAAFVLLAACGSKQAAPVHADPKPEEKACVTGGCSGELCVEDGESPVTTCEMRAEYECYRSATCERQAEGECGWTETDELKACVAEKAGGGEVM